MKIVLVSTDDIHGGAAISCYRLLNALKKNGASVKALVQTKKSQDEIIETTTKTKFKALLNFYRFVFERIIFLFFERSKEVRFAFTIGNTGESINSNSLIKSADLINLHWINRGFLSILTLRKLLKLKKPVVWTLHDMWAFTGGCHYAGDCKNFRTMCHDCPFLRNPSSYDLSTWIYNRKYKKLFANNQDKIVFVTSSDWLCEEARSSSLLKGYRIESIPIPVNTALFRQMDKKLAKEKFGLSDDSLYIVFAAMNVSDKRKGFSYFLDSLSIIKDNHPELAEKLKLVVFGKIKDSSVLDKIPFPVISLGFVSSQERIAEIFNAVNLFVIPSLEDNLPNIIMESLACGTPVVGFKTGGIPQMIDHLQTGYVAEYKSHEDLAKGIAWCLIEADKSLLSTQSREKALTFFSEEVVSKQYMNLFADVRKNFYGQ